MMHNLRTPLTSLNVVSSMLMEEIEMEKKSRSESRDMLEHLASATLSPRADDKRVSAETLSLLQQSVGQMKVV
jgi:endonuclease III